MKTRNGTGAALEIIGRLKAVPELKEVNGNLVANIDLAVDEQEKESSESYKDVVEWHKVALWGRAAEFVRDHARNGMRLKIEARVKNKKVSVIDQENKERYFTIPQFSAHDVEPMDAIKKPDSNEPQE
jgi:single-strand DNA-binding protein